MLINCQMWITLSQTQFLVKANQVFIFENNEAVIKMIMEGRSSTVRRVSRTHRVGFDWSFDRAHLDRRLVDKRQFHRDYWNHLPRLFNFMIFSILQPFQCNLQNQKHVEEHKVRAEIHREDESTRCGRSKGGKWKQSDQNQMGCHEQRNTGETKSPGSTGCTGVQRMDGRDCEHYVPPPGLDLVKGVLSHAAAAGKSKDHVVAVVDVRRAYFFAEPLPRTFVELPDYFDIDTRTRCCD